ncbi:hypothetical protein FRC11_001418, partial [Ceratobasidium sp. 423]
YYNESMSSSRWMVPFLRNLQELRILFNPNTPLCTHLTTNQRHWGPLPSGATIDAQVVAQDATWYLGNTPNDSYVQQMDMTVLMNLSTTTSTPEREQDILETLRADAEKLADPTWNAAFYDDIAEHIPNYVQSKNQSTESVSGYDFQDNEVDTKAYQYRGDIKSDGSIEIPRVKAGNYRLTAYADGIFGQYTQDNITAKARIVDPVVVKANWKEESAGKELWRLGTLDKTAGEFLRGFAYDPNKTHHPEDYRIYWGYYDFPTDFPNGVNFTIGRSDISKD